MLPLQLQDLGGVAHEENPFFEFHLELLRRHVSEMTRGAGKTARALDLAQSLRAICSVWLEGEPATSRQRFGGSLWTIYKGVAYRNPLC